MTLFVASSTGSESLSMDTEVKHISKKLKTAAGGDRKSLKWLGIKHGVQYPCPPSFHPTKTSKKDLAQEIDDVMFFAEAANRLHLQSAEHVARTALEHMQHSYACLFDKHPNVDGILSGKALAEELNQNVSEMKRAMNILSEVDVLASQPEKEDEKEQSDSSSDPESSHEEFADDGFSETSSSSENDETPTPKRATSTPKRATSPTPKTSPKKQKTSSPIESSASKIAKRSHHKKSKCPLPKCSFFGSNLRRHLDIHVKKREVDENEVQRILTIVHAGDSQRGKQQARKGRRPLQGKQKKWCPIPGCDQIVLDVGRHLQNEASHGIPKDSRQYTRLVRMAKLYTGIAELQCSLVPPPPAIVELTSGLDTSDTAAADASGDAHAASASCDAANSPVIPGPSTNTRALPAASAAATSPVIPDSSRPIAAAHAPKAHGSDFNPGPSTSADGAANTASPAGSSPVYPGPFASQGASITAPAVDNSTTMTAAALPPSSTAVTTACEATDAAHEPVDDASEDVPESEEETQDDDSSVFSAVGSLQYFTAKNPKTNRHKWLVLFFDFLSRPTAGDKKETIKLQHAAQMRLLLEALDPNGDDILCLLQNEGDAVWRLWVKPHIVAGTKKPGTLISYLTSYDKFLRFVTHERFNKRAPPLQKEQLETFANVLKDLKGWRSTVDSHTYHVKNQRLVEETEGLLSLDELAQIKSSAVYNDAVRLLILAGQGHQLNFSEFVLARDFLVTRFSLDTGTRPGPLNNATLQEYMKGKVENGGKVMLVARHKRAKDGPAICAMLPELYKFMEIYRRNIRPHFALPDEDALFVTNEGNAFREGTIGRRMKFFVAKCGVVLGGRLAFVDMRKLITTEMLKCCTPEEKAILRCVLAHSEKTSQEWYTRPNLTSTGMEALTIVQRLLDPNEKARFNAEAESSRPSTPKLPPSCQSEELKKDTVAAPTETSTLKQAPKSCHSSEGASTRAASSGIVPPTESSGPVGLTSKQKEELLVLFSEKIKAGQTVTRAEAKTSLAGTSGILSVLLTDQRLKQVTNFVNYQARRTEISPPTASSDDSKAKVSEWLDQFDDPSMRSLSVKRNVWSSEETAIFEDSFKDHPTLPSTTIIREMVGEDTPLAEIHERVGWKRFYQKIRNLFKNRT